MGEALLRHIINNILCYSPIGWSRLMGFLQPGIAFLLLDTSSDIGYIY